LIGLNVGIILIDILVGVPLAAIANLIAIGFVIYFGRLVAKEGRGSDGRGGL